MLRHFHLIIRGQRGHGRRPWYEYQGTCLNSHEVLTHGTEVYGPNKLAGYPGESNGDPWCDRWFKWWHGFLYSPTSFRRMHPQQRKQVSRQSQTQNCTHLRKNVSITFHCALIWAEWIQKVSENIVWIFMLIKVYWCPGRNFSKIYWLKFEKIHQRALAML